jgi:Uma2 family endonuclease
MATVSFSTTGASPIELPLRQFDADEYMAMVDAGVFEERRRVELIGGFVVDMAPSGPDHSYVIMRFPRRLFATLMADFELWIQGTLKVDRRHVFDPDFMLLRPRTQSYKEALPTPADVALIVEVAGSSLRRDAGVKLPVYARYGITDYWIADLEREVLVVHRKPSGDAYVDVQAFSSDAMISPLASPEFAVKVSDLFA